MVTEAGAGGGADFGAGCGGQGVFGRCSSGEYFPQAQLLRWIWNGRRDRALECIEVIRREMPEERRNGSERYLSPIAG